MHAIAGLLTSGHVVLPDPGLDVTLFAPTDAVRFAAFRHCELAWRWGITHVRQAPICVRTYLLRSSNAYTGSKELMQWYDATGIRTDPV